MRSQLVPFLFLVKPPTFLNISLSDDESAAGILDDLASLDLSATDNAASARRETWTSIEISDDEDDDFVSARSAVSGSTANISSDTLDGSNMVSPPATAPEVVFDQPPVTPGSILRKQLGASSK